MSEEVALRLISAIEEMTPHLRGIRAELGFIAFILMMMGLFKNMGGKE